MQDKQGTQDTQDRAIYLGRGQRPDGIHHKRLDWWHEATFGMFIHWGLYALLGGEWKGQRIPYIGECIMYYARIPIAEYEPLASQFNPVRFNAAEWVSLAKRAGQKYIVITAKHQDGFSMFKSAVSPYNIVDATPFGRDSLKELAEECAKQGIKLGFYYAHVSDWHHPGGGGVAINDWDYDPNKKDFPNYFENYVKPQVTELLTNYGPVCLIWFDDEGAITRAQSQSLLDLVHRLQPDCLVNGRIGNTLGDYGEAGDNKLPGHAVSGDWESPGTINDTWGYKSYDDNWKSTSDLLHRLVDIVSKGGNYLLNVGPTAEGIIPQPEVDRLLEMGAWLGTNGEAVYGAKAGPIQGLEWCRTTIKPGKVYLHVFDWPIHGTIRVPDLSQAVREAYLLADTGQTPLAVRRDGEQVIIEGPASAPDSADTVVVLAAD